MGHENWLNDNVDAIVKFINDTKSVKHVYYTFKTGDWFVVKKEEINSKLRKDVTFGSIFTPSGNGFGNSLPVPFKGRAASIAHCWVWNGLAHDVPVNKPGYTHFDHDWLKRSGVNVNQF